MNILPAYVPEKVIRMGKRGESVRKGIVWSSPTDRNPTQWGRGVYKSKYLFYNLAMRIFIGIKLDDAVLDSIEKFLKPFKKMASPVKWTARENLHVTLKFIGEVPTEKFKQIDTLLAEGDFKTGVIDLNITGCGKFGKGRDLNIFWVGLEKNPKLEDLFNRIENTLKQKI